MGLMALKPLIRHGVGGVLRPPGQAAKGTFSRLNRILFMGRVTRVSIVDQRALNQTTLWLSKPPRQILTAAGYLRAVRSALRMSQAVLARLSGVSQANIAKIEAGRFDPQVGTLRRLFAAMSCDVLVLPRPKKRLGDVLADRYLKQRWDPGIWDSAER